MVNIRLVILSFVIVGVAKTNGGQVLSASKPSTVSAIPTIKGRLLTPEEGCGYSKESKARIVGGAPAKNGAYPWVALLGFRRTIEDSKGYFVSFKQSFDCGGSLITSKHVLSAAHCIDDDLILVRLGEYDQNTTSDGDNQDVSVDHAIKHEQFDFLNMINDISIIHLAHDVEFNDRIRPACLPIDGDMVHRSFVGSNPFVVGWGSTTFDVEAKGSTSVLMELQIPMVGTEECEREYRRAAADPRRKAPDCKSGVVLVFDEHVVCAGYKTGGKGAYHGDSGGPLMLPVHQNGTFPYYQIGIVSGSDSCIKPGFFGVYQSVQHYADWIHENLKAKNSTE